MRAIRSSPSSRAGRRASSWVLALGVSIGAATATVPGAAAAPAADAEAVAASRAKYRQALVLQAKNDWRGALILLEEVAEVHETAQVRFNLAFTLEHLGELAHALAGYERALELARQARVDHVVRAASERVAALGPRVPRLSLRSQTEGATVTVDGARVDLGGEPLRLNPGSHAIQAEAPGHAGLRANLVLEEGETRELVIALETAARRAPDGPRVAAAPSPPRPARAGVARAGPEPREDRSATSERGANWAAFIVGGAGIASLAASTLFYVLRAQTMSKLDARCGDARDRCPPELRAYDQRGELYTTIANVTLAAGAAGVGVGAGLLVFSSESAEQDPSRARSSSERRRAGVALSVSGRF
jgi:hypothetical protein